MTDRDRKYIGMLMGAYVFNVGTFALICLVTGKGYLLFGIFTVVLTYIAWSTMKRVQKGEI